MKSGIILFLFCVFSVTLSLGQKSHRGDVREDSTRHHSRFGNIEKLDSARSLFIKNKLQLSEEQSKKFWPVYDQYSSKKKELRNQLKSIRKEQEDLNISEDQLKTSLKNIRKVKKEEMDLEENFQNTLFGFLTVRQVVSLSNAEREFMMMLRKKIQEDKKTNHLKSH